jgi:uncharacterized membrane protein YhiD involved in acid resistance
VRHLPIAILAAAAVAGAALWALALAQSPGPPTGLDALEQKSFVLAEDLTKELSSAVIRLPLAAVLGAALALRPRRRGTPPRRPPVVQTQIVLAIVGSAIMLVVGASLARAFGIVGVASLVRYRSKIDDPKDAGVMLGALAVGLAAGVGLYALAVVSTAFLFLVLLVIESLEPRERVFSLTVNLGKDTAAQRPKIETILRRIKADYELRGVSEEELAYQLTVPSEIQTDRVSRMLTALSADGKGAVEWKEGGAKGNKSK